MLGFILRRHWSRPMKLLWLITNISRLIKLNRAFVHHTHVCAVDIERPKSLDLSTRSWEISANSQQRVLTLGFSSGSRNEIRSWRNRWNCIFPRPPRVLHIQTHRSEATTTKNGSEGMNECLMLKFTTQASESSAYEKEILHLQTGALTSDGHQPNPPINRAIETDADNITLVSFDFSRLSSLVSF